MKAIIMAVGLLLPMAAYAQPAPISPAPRCEPLAKLREAAPKDAKLVALNPGQYHFMLGYYAASISTPEGSPPGEGALLVNFGKTADLFWTKGDQICITQIRAMSAQGFLPPAYAPLRIVPELLSKLNKLTAGKDEIDTPDDTSEDRKL
jgi:hypothetical protein